MKTIRIFSVITLLMAITASGFAQTSKTETLQVAGECGMCKKKIEKAAKDAGATYALWNKDTKILTVKYNSATTNTAKIEQKIAEVGYDTPGFKATDEAYNKLDECCQYDRVAMDKKMSCCSEKCEMKDGKCKDEAACKDMDCCKDPAVCKDKGCCNKDGAMSCCKKSDK
jgi:hypothetical protein